MIKKVYPVNGCIALLPQEQTQTDSGILLPESKYKSRFGEVIPVFEPYYDGEGNKISSSLIPGSMVVYSGRAEGEVDTADGKLLIVKETEVIAILETAEVK